MKKQGRNRGASPRRPWPERELKEWAFFYQKVFGAALPVEKINPHTFPRGIGPSGKDLKPPFIPAVHPHTKIWCGGKRPQSILEGVGIKIPKAPSGFDRIIVVAKGLAPDRVYAVCAAHFPCVRHFINLDRDVSKNERVPDRTYAVLARGGSEPDVELSDLSADELRKKKIKNITLLEYMLCQLKYFTETGKLMDVKDITMCAGSRYKDGRVPTAISHKGELKIHWCSPHEKNQRMRSREVLAR